MAVDHFVADVAVGALQGNNAFKYLGGGSLGSPGLNRIFGNHYDIVANVGDQTGTMKSFDVPSGRLALSSAVTVTLSALEAYRTPLSSLRHKTRRLSVKAGGRTATLSRQLGCQKG